MVVFGLRAAVARDTNLPLFADLYPFALEPFVMVTVVDGSRRAVLDLTKRPVIAE